MTGPTGVRRLVLKVLIERGGTGELYDLPRGRQELVVPAAEDLHDVWVSWGPVQDLTLVALAEAHLITLTGQKGDHSPHTGCYRPQCQSDVGPLRPHLDTSQGDLIQVTDLGRQAMA